MTIMKLQSSKFDELYTPPDAVFPLLRHLPKKYKTVWCPCDTEDSEIVTQLQATGRAVIASHIKDGYDFFEWEPEDGYDCIVTNPPYSNKDDFIRRCNELGVPWALLLPLDALCGSKRFPLVKDCGCITIAHRVDFTGKGSNWFYNVWVCNIPELNGKWLKEL